MRRFSLRRQHLPLLERTALGVHLDEASVHWVQLHSLGGRIRLVDHGTVAHTGDPTEALVALRAQFRHPPATATHLDSLHVRYHVLDAPSSEMDEAFAAWLETQRRERTPAGLSPEAIATAYRYEPDAEEPDHGRCHLALARREAVAARLEKLTQADLPVDTLGTGLGEIGWAFLFEASFREGVRAVIWCEGQQAWMLRYEEGRLQQVQPLYSDTSLTVESLRDEARAQLQLAGLAKAESVSILLTGAVLPTTADDAPPVPASPQFPTSYLRQHQCQELHSTHTIAAGLAVKQLFPDLDTLNFQDADVRAQHVQAREKREALHTILGIAGILMVCLLLLTLAEVGMQALLGRAEANLLAVADQLARVEHVERLVQRQERHLREAGHLFQDRTQVTALLETLGRSVPDRLWLRSLAVAPASKPGAVRVRLAGVSHSEAEIASLLQHLEQESAFGEVRLLLTEDLPAKAVYRQSKLRAVPLDRFEITLQVHPARLKRPASLAAPAPDSLTHTNS